MFTTFVWLGIVCTALGLIAVLIMPILVFGLNSRFDPDWKDKRWTKVEAEALPVFSVFRMSLYVGAVASPTLARKLFGHIPGGQSYDFRRRAGPILHALSLYFVFVGGAAWFVAALLGVVLPLMR